MNPVRTLHCLLLLSLPVLAPAAVAIELVEVELRGLDPELASNVRARLSLEKLDAGQRATLSEQRLSYLLRAATAEVREGIEPFGYYDAKVDTSLARRGEQVSVIIAVDPGQPVRVRALTVAVAGPGHDDPRVAAQVAAFLPRTGAPFRHDQYERSKAAIGLELDRRGYFDAALGVHRVEVTRADAAADIALGWTSGRRYALGAVHFNGSQLRPGVLDPLVPWRAGEPYDQARLLELQQSLADTGYFTGVSLEPQSERAAGEQVPVEVTVVPAPRSAYELGLRYGTDSGAGVHARLERRWLNDRGHKLLLDLNLAQFRSEAIVQYRIPAFAWLDGWYSYSIGAREEQIEGLTSQYVDLAATRSGRWRDWNLLAGLNFKRERFDSLAGGEYDYATVVFPSLWGQWKRGDETNAPRRGLALTVETRGGLRGIGSDLDFLQLRAEGRYIRGVGDSNRLLLRAELGTTFSDDFQRLPPSLRYYAGGDRSVRGYGYKEIGEREGDRVLGGKHLAVASVEFEHSFTPVWGGAVFVDAGDAFDAGFDAQVGVGAGLRWRSPVGPVRIDLAHGIGQANQDLRLHITVGPDL